MESTDINQSGNWRYWSNADPHIRNRIMTCTLPEPKVRSEKTITKSIAYANNLVLVGCGAALLTLIIASIFMIDWGEPKDALTVAIVLFVPVLGLVRWLRGEKVKWSRDTEVLLTFI